MIFTLNSIVRNSGKASLCSLSFFNAEGLDNSWTFTKFVPNSIVATAKDGLLEIPFWCCKNFFCDFYVEDSISKQAKKACHHRDEKPKAVEDALNALHKLKEVAEQTDIKEEPIGEFLGEPGQEIFCEVKIQKILDLGTHMDDTRWVQVSNGIHTHLCHWEHPTWTTLCVIFEDEQKHIISAYVTAEKKQSVLYDAFENNKTLKLSGVIADQKIYQNIRQVQLNKQFKITVVE